MASIRIIMRRCMGKCEQEQLALVQILGLGCYMSVGRPSPWLWVDLLQYVGRASTNFVVDLVHVIGFQWLERIAPAIFV